MSVIGLPPATAAFAAGGIGGAGGGDGSGDGGSGGTKSGSTPGSGLSTEESPQADFSMDDWGFSTELLETLGMSVENDGQAPLWLHRSDIGSSQLPQAGMESFFLRAFPHSPRFSYRIVFAFEPFADIACFHPSSFDRSL
jgi:hypothetical protein